MLRLPPWLPVANFVVADTSMQPALRPGDCLLVSKWSGLHVGDVLIFVDPQDRTQVLVKRLHRRTPDGRYEVRGDNLNVSRDSRTFGSVPRRLVVGKVIYRYLPAERRGRL